jgi:UDP-N-acetylmuramate: L-alanyl-gamma-D-glutamyl-meso-diaminopimelate ligase
MQFHFIAIGGSAMHNLALALHDKGYSITGSDDVIFEPAKGRLHAQGLLPEETGWFPNKVHGGLDGVVLGMHAKKDNPELIKALDLGIPIYSYPEFLYEQSKNKTRVVIGGSHGKTTITSMILHVLKYHGREVDYMVGAQLDGFDRMVHLTEENDFIVLEGDEYLSSALDLRPKFHLYQPNIALLSGIAWDHINVFGTFEDYLDQFRIFIESIVDGGSLTYNAEDAELKKLVEQSTNPIRKLPYSTPEYEVADGSTLLHTEEGLMPVGVFGGHNMSNLAGAKWICQHLGVDEADFYEAIASFTGASKRLEKIAESDGTLVFKDFAHAPSKVKAATKAVKEQYPDRRLIACLELHTYSSLNKTFLNEYRGALDEADQAVVFYSPDAVAIKRLDPVNPEQIMASFARKDLEVFTNAQQFRDYLYNLNPTKAVLLLMSSGNYGGLDLIASKSHIERD